MRCRMGSNANNQLIAFFPPKKDGRLCVDESLDFIHQLHDQVLTHRTFFLHISPSSKNLNVAILLERDLTQT